MSLLQNGTEIDKRQRLLLHIKAQLPDAEPNTTADRIEQILEQAAELKKNHGKVYSPLDGELVEPKAIVTGGRWRVRSRQRRWEKQYLLKLPRGGQQVRWPRYLIAMLGKEFVCGTGQVPTFSNFDSKLSRFEAFAKPFLSQLKVRNPKNRIREYVEERKRPNPYHPLKYDSSAICTEES